MKSQAVLENLVEKELNWLEYFDGIDPVSFTCNLALTGLSSKALNKIYAKWLKNADIRDISAEGFVAQIKEDHLTNKNIIETPTSYIVFRSWEYNTSNSKTLGLGLEVIKKQRK